MWLEINPESKARCGGHLSKEENVAEIIMLSMAWLPTSRRTSSGLTPVMLCSTADDVKASDIASMRRPITRNLGVNAHNVQDGIFVRLDH